MTPNHMAHGWRRGYRPPTKAYLVSPSGRIHSLKLCSGGAGPTRMKPVQLTRGEYEQARKCRCAHKW